MFKYKITEKNKIILKNNDIANWFSFVIPFGLILCFFQFDGSILELFSVAGGLAWLFTGILFLSLWIPINYIRSKVVLDPDKIIFYTTIGKKIISSESIQSISYDTINNQQYGFGPELSNVCFKLNHNTYNYSGVLRHVLLQYIAVTDGRPENWKPQKIKRSMWKVKAPKPSGLH